MYMSFEKNFPHVCSLYVSLYTLLDTSILSSELVIQVLNKPMLTGVHCRIQLVRVLGIYESLGPSLNLICL